MDLSLKYSQNFTTHNLQTNYAAKVINCGFGVASSMRLFTSKTMPHYLNYCWGWCNTLYSITLSAIITYLDIKHRIMFIQQIKKEMQQFLITLVKKQDPSSEEMGQRQSAAIELVQS